MGKYGQVAIKAVEIIQSKKIIDPKEAWNKAYSELYTTRCKNCPKYAFIGSVRKVL